MPADLKSRTASLSVNEPTNHRTRLSRSPHPYQRSSINVPDRFFMSEPRDHSETKRVPKLSSSGTSEKHNEGAGIDYFDVDGRKRRKLSTSPSESGTEADDERASHLKGLPAPPWRPRKGLKDARCSGLSPIPSPLLTPSYLDDAERRTSGEKSSKQQRRRTQSGGEQQSQEIGRKLARRRRAEFMRRLSETVCLAIVGYLTLMKTNLGLKRELFNYTTIVICIYLTYPFRLLWHQYRRSLDKFLPLAGLRIPAAYDPAPLLYPIFIPAYVAVSLSSSGTSLVLPNLILGICSLPSQVVPFANYGLASPHWILCILPISLSRPAIEMFPFEALNTSCLGFKIDSELLVLLYPLHRSLIQSLGFLSTTSLLPAELHLLSVAMINLLLFSRSPQATILKALLWIGGLSVFIFCKKILQWSVEIARVPSWRFRRTPKTSMNRNVVLHAVDDCLGGVLHNHFTSKDRGESSESEEDGNFIIKKSGSAPLQRLKPGRAKPNQYHPEPYSAISALALDQLDQHKSQERAVEVSNNGLSRNRRHTLPTYAEETLDRPALSRSDLRRRLRSLSTRPRSFVALTSAQATVLKWIYALYIYIVVVATIAIPVRYYVGQCSLRGSEPAGWALGYLLGGISAFRLNVVVWNLENWICLPRRTVDEPANLGLADLFRLGGIGAPNVRLMICGYCVAWIITGLIVVLQLSAVVEVDTRRKVFHGMMVAMFLPTIFIDPAFIALALVLALAMFLLLDLFRASQLPPISKPLTYFLAPYVDGRDHRGPIIVSHIFLLIGCAIPLWLSLAATERSGQTHFEGWEVVTRDLGMVSGVICVGMGDAAASLIGRRYGRRKWPWSGGKSLEGSLAFAIAVTLGLITMRGWFIIGGWKGQRGDSWELSIGKAVLAALGSSFTEAVLTGGNDNVIVPIILWLLVRGLYE